ncbi:(2S)-methylsuccinyl-CoA dehydrogenase [Amaricoccus macauensis]|uniref:(2S)-methylsuccinyl-CoA dehydrogenase n=1 Tax=Amaricoccus macauensis TaxID=57001 RepID=A0A840SS05_9RHOB|nr:acyl-CoA dehydrogenase family protein [Amaricoccus macauensis]MBB5222002.1 (2S)-methylsuccinyl-CoA dehydrogenase [Amaricoccus macauensis]
MTEAVRILQPDSPLLPDVLILADAAASAAAGLVGTAREALAQKLSRSGRISNAALEADQFAAHGLAWMATYAESLRELVHWALRLGKAGQFGETEALILQIAFGEYLGQLAGGIPMSQTEVVRPETLGLDDAAIATFRTAEVRTLIAAGNTDAARARLVELMIEQAGVASFGATGLDDDYEMIRDQFRRFADEKVVPFAQEWHHDDKLIPIEILNEMGELGTFGLTIPEEYGGAGLSKTAMCVVSEELSRGYIGVGSLGTRSEIAAELILGGGTEEQKAEWLPKLAAAEVLPTAVFTEPNTGSDLGSLRTRAVRDGDDWVVTGNKTWITHAARTDLMTMLVRTDPATTDHTGLSMLLAPKPRGTDETPFPAEGMTGGEIEVLGYRGMKEYELAFDGFRVPGGNLLGGVEGQGFRQLMRTFESARIQTAARAIGVAQCALELGMKYAQDRKQFGKPLIAFPRVYGKIAMMAVEIMVARQITYFAAREKDEDRRCDLEAGMAKLLAARIAWSNADVALQIHGGNGFALEYPISRVLCDARILSIFEGAAEIQAQVIARRLLES